MQDEHIDWEAMMKVTSQQAKQSARNSERTLGGVAEVLRNQKSQAATLSVLAKNQKELLALLSSKSKGPHAEQTSAHHGSESSLRIWPLVLLSSAVAAAVALGVSGLSW